MFWTPKWGLKNEPKNGARIWPPKWSPKMAPQKWGPKMAPKRGPNILIKKKSKLYLHLNPFFGCNFCTPFWGAIFGPHFGGQILAPFLGPFFNPHFGVQNMVQNLQFFCCQSFHLHSNFFQQTCITKCICSLGLASCISAHNPILHLAKPLKNRKVLIATNVAHEQDGLKPQNLILWRSLNAAPVFHMKNDPVLGGRQSWYFWNKNLHPASIDNGDVSTYQLPGPDNVEALAEYVRSIWAHWQEILITPTDFKNGGGCHAKHRISATC